MSITYELRKWANEHLYKSGIKSDLLTIADRIDEAHFNALVGRSEIGVQAVLSDPEQYGLTALPKDADGEYIHIGDVIAYEDNTKPKEVVALVPPSVVMVDNGPRYADMCRHYQPDSWERIIEDAVNVHGNGFNPRWTDERDALVARCKELAGDAQ